MIGFYYGTEVPGADAKEGIYFINQDDKYSIYIKRNGKDLIKYGETNTHYTNHLKVGNSATATDNTAATNGNVYMNILDDTTIKDSHNIVGEGATTVTSDINGKIIIASNAEVNQNAFSNIVVGDTTITADLKTDTFTLAGSNVTLIPDINNDKITIGITKTNITDALGYIPPTSDVITNDEIDEICNAIIYDQSEVQV